MAQAQTVQVFPWAELPAIWNDRRSKSLVILCTCRYIGSHCPGASHLCCCWSFHFARGQALAMSSGVAGGSGSWSCKILQFNQSVSVWLSLMLFYLLTSFHSFFAWCRDCPTTSCRQEVHLSLPGLHTEREAPDSPGGLGLAKPSQVQLGSDPTHFCRTCSIPAETGKGEGTTTHPSCGFAERRK